MEDGHTLFDYDVRLNDTIQLLVRQSLVLPVPVPGSSSGIKERDSELSDTDSGCGLAQSESDKSSNSGEAANEPEGKADEDECDETELGLYKVGLLHRYPHAALDPRGWAAPHPALCHHSPVVETSVLRGSFSAPKAEPWNWTCGCLPCGPSRGRLNSDLLPSSP